MTDVFDEKKRSEVMSQIRGKGNRSTELALVKVFRKTGIKGWRRHVVIKIKMKESRNSSPGKKVPTLVIKPDFVFRKERVAMFTDGCFWHRCPLHSNFPKKNREFWIRKLNGNVERDRLVNRELRKAGWRIIRIWEHELSRDTTALVRKMQRSLRQSP